MQTRVKSGNGVIVILSLVGILLSIVLIIIFASKKIPLYVYAVACAMIVAVFNKTNPFTALASSFAPGLGEYIANNVMLFVSSAIFAAFMDESGCAKYIALKLAGLSKKSKNSKFAALMYMALVQIILSVAGINLFVVIFLLVSINRTLFEELDIPWNLFLANTWATGTVTVWALPGMPSIQNLIPTTYLGTTAMAGAKLGIFMGVEITVLCIGYLIFCLKRAEKKDLHFLPEGNAVKEKELQIEERPLDHINIVTALIPPAAVLILMNVVGLSAVSSLLAGTGLTFVLFFKNFKRISMSVLRGIEDGLGVLLPVAFMTAYGSVVATTDGFQVILGALQKIPGPEVFQVYIAANVCALVCGSVSGGLGIMFTTLGGYLGTLSLPTEIIHRVAVAGASGLDTMPHAASIHSLMRVSCIEFSWDSYKYLFVNNLVLTIITGLTGCVLVSMGFFL